jgi:hypothetical protein
MNIDKIMSKLDEFFDQSASKQKKKHDKLLAIIEKLERKKAQLKEEMIIESEKNETSEKFHDMDKELRVITKLLKKAKKHNAPEQEAAE